MACLCWGCLVLGLRRVETLHFMTLPPPLDLIVLMSPWGGVLVQVLVWVKLPWDVGQVLWVDLNSSS